ncbi:beta-lactamase family protein [Dyadobacter sp. CY261]|nr:beta-lactamase family protein [Dyadobacter sp. CY261]
MKLRYNFFVYALLLLMACNSDEQQLTGIWHTELETVPGLRSAFDIELRRNWPEEKWNGRFELAELMVTAPIESIKIKDLKMELGLGGGAKFTGDISTDRATIKGILNVPGQKPETITLTRIPRWSAQVPARIGPDKQPLKTWKYEAPSPTTDGWKVGKLRPAVTDSKELKGLFQQILQGKFHGLDALLVAQNGQLVLEEYFYLGGRDRIHSVQSVTKSVNSLLLGMARDRALIQNLDAPLKSYFPEYADSIRSKAVSPSLRHALTMSAALDWTEDIPYSDPKNDAVRMNNSSDLYQYVLSKGPDPKDKPGERFEYNSGLSILLGGVLKNAVGKPADVFARETLFKELGIKQFAWTNMGGKVHTGGGLFLRPRDLLKIGQMVLDSGKWDGSQVVSQSWIKESTAFILPVGKSGGDFGYGYQWWRGVMRVKGATLPVIYASGYGGQMLYIIPDLDLVALTFHHNASDTTGSHSITWKVIEEAVFAVF